MQCAQIKGNSYPRSFLEKRDGYHRLILNLKGLNEYLEYKHFNPNLGSNFTTPVGFPLITPK